MKTIEDLRRNSNYPNFRSLVAFFTVVGYVAVGVLALIAVFGGLLEGNVFGAIGFFVGAVLWCIIVRVSQELCLMAADMADAAVQIATAHPRALVTGPIFGPKSVS